MIFVTWFVSKSCLYHTGYYFCQARTVRGLRKLRRSLRCATGTHPGLAIAGFLISWVIRYPATSGFSDCGIFSEGWFPPSRSRLQG